MERVKKILANIFSVASYYSGVKKHKVFTVFGIKLKFRVGLKKNTWKFVRANKPCPLFSLNNDIEPKREKVYLSVVAIFKDEPDVVEWIEYHKLAGVERFYLYDNESVEDYELILKPYIESGLVVYKKVEGRCMQKPVYKDAIYRYKTETEWLAIIDLDEYIVPVEVDDIKDFLRTKDNHPAVVVNWVMFDSNGLDKREKDKTVIESFVRVYENYQKEINKTIKSIVKPEKVRFTTSVHACNYKNNELAVDENGNEYCGNLYFQTEKNSINKIRINHYHCKSREEYLSKINKGFADKKRARVFDETKLNFENTTYDYVILKYLDKLKDALNVGVLLK